MGWTIMMYKNVPNEYGDGPYQWTTIQVPSAHLGLDYEQYYTLSALIILHQCSLYFFTLKIHTKGSLSQKHHSSEEDKLMVTLYFVASVSALRLGGCEFDPQPYSASLLGTQHKRLDRQQVKGEYLYIKSPHTQGNQRWAPIIWPT